MNLLNQRFTETKWPPNLVGFAAQTGRPSNQTIALSRLDELSQSPNVILARGNRVVIDVSGKELEDRVLIHIGRLRAEAFATVGEGGGSSMDTDAYDASYRHLIVWDCVEKAVLGSYRYACVDEFGKTNGTDPIYTSSLFDYRPDFFKSLGSSIELGRAFVTVAYQRTVEPLLLLWQGVGRVIEHRPQHRHLFGAVSISRTYSSACRKTMLRELWRQTLCRQDSWPTQSLVTAKVPVAYRELKSRNCFRRFRGLMSLRNLDQTIRGMDSKGRGIPVLVAKYLELGGKFLAFHDDRKFGSIACLTLIDLLSVEQRMLLRLMGPSGVQALQARNVRLT